MNRIAELKSGDVFANRIRRYQELVPFKIKDILLVSSMYDFFLFEEDGRLYELIRTEYQTLHLSHAPEIVHAPTGAEALEMLASRSFDIIIATLHIDDMTVRKFGQAVRALNLATPIIILAYDNQERKELEAHPDNSLFEKIFIWQGDFKLIIGIVKYLEDKYNVQNDTDIAGVQTLILVEDNVKYYSTFLPIMYTELLNQSRRLISEGVNLTHKYLRMRVRPKILLATTYEEAWEYFQRFRKYILGVLSDIEYPKDGAKNPEAGILLAKAIREQLEDVPILLQSSNLAMRDKLDGLKVTFLHKNSPRMLNELREFFYNSLSFGDFVFRMPDGSEVGRARDLQSLADTLEQAPEQSVEFHASRNHFSNWLKARTEFWLAHKFRPQKVEDFSSVDGLRKKLVSDLRQYIALRVRGLVSDFDPKTFDPKNSFARIGNGSLGGKARGLAFVNSLINNYGLGGTFEDIEISVPSCVVIATDVFDQFLEWNNLISFALTCEDDVEIAKRFVQAPYFPEDIVHKLRAFVECVRGPLAIRSSSLLEDSQFQPFAGVYETYMIPNNNPDSEVRLRELLQTVRSVYASTYYKAAKDYMKATAYRLEEEKMAVIIQRMVGGDHGGKFYPEFAGVAKSYNFYPVPPQKSEDGIALVALGLGKTVVDGGNVVRFCPKYPRHLMQFFSTTETIRNAQQRFYALDLHGEVDLNVNQTHDMLVQSYDLTEAEKDQTLHYTGSTYSHENDSVYDGISRPGKRVVTFAPILKHKIFPLPDILDMILEIGSWGMGTEVEIEFAVNLTPPPGKPKEFAMLQMRPLVLHREWDELEIKDEHRENMLCGSMQVLGNGIIQGMRDIVYVDTETFERGKSQEAAYEVSHFNAKMLALKRPYLLIGVGRWGSLDPWLGIPVTWDQISGAAVIVEAGFKDFSVTPSQGSHFFQNITSFRIGYFTVNSGNPECFIDWDWLNSQLPAEAKTFTRHVELAEPVVVKINGQLNKGVILKKAGLP